MPFLLSRINDEWSFDDSIAKYGCKVLAFDPTMNKGDHNRSSKIQFFNLGLSDVDSEGTPGEFGKAAWKTRTLKTIIKERGHENVSISQLYFLFYRIIFFDNLHMKLY